VALERIHMLLFVILYGCETWSVALREGHGFRVFENRVLRRILDLRGSGRRLEKTA
jgi:hypothetical protein